MGRLSFLAVLVAAAHGVAPAADSAAGQLAPPSGRPVMTAQPAAGRDQPPSSRELVDARAELQRRYREPLFRADTAAGANRAADLFLEAGAAEPDRALKWLLLAEARRLGAAAGNAAVIHRAVSLASATYEFDELDLEYRALGEIPLRGLSPAGAAGVAEAAEAVAARAEIDGRMELALSAQDLAIRGWQRAGATEACRLAMARHAEITAASQGQRPTP